MTIHLLARPGNTMLKYAKYAVVLTDDHVIKIINRDSGLIEDVEPVPNGGMSREYIEIINAQIVYTFYRNIPGTT